MSMATLQALPEPRSLFNPPLPKKDAGKLQTAAKDPAASAPACVTPTSVSKLKPSGEQCCSPDTIPSLDQSFGSNESPALVSIPEELVCMPEEVTLGTNDSTTPRSRHSSSSSSPVATIRLSLMIELLKKRNQRLASVEKEAKEYKRQLDNTAGLLDIVTEDLNTAREQTKELMEKNTLLLNELEMAKEKEASSVETQDMLRGELSILKGCLFVATVYIMIGGKVELVAFMALVWLATDLVR